ncbi:hypothetical protein TVAG_029500 [Trichomonas vaginalis G3]|uniref:Uncharacterized protein n=1 Tax=Trichomonas vaginalis (strain ATCC PRA-98 / G3) TaxID=412133 RepID=A2FX99_TRIV3|nr:serine-type endopeptidase protein [Trichomonas vaginalis G3]EAX90470.1 hypothetical protein TVAG_029500 [Trichomonas vaginalis G3]KAI5496321.1 serine-type endopeptidase protein [Trichomonas vaginalis G3]|eukprot:XP_001303400.1 hypothetical protein [Trichomonas vaginalis G3]
MADSAMINHTSYAKHAIKEQFINIFTDQHINMTNRNNTIATSSLGLAAGRRNSLYDGVATNANIASYYFMEYGKMVEHLQSVICYESKKWNISILQYSYLEYTKNVWPKDYEIYIEPERLPRKIADECLYNPDEGN